LEPEAGLEPATLSLSTITPLISLVDLDFEVVNPLILLVGIEVRKHFDSGSFGFLKVTSRS